MIRLSEQLFEIFYRGSSHHAKARNQNGSVSYFPIEGVPGLEEIIDHLRGVSILGSYTVQPNNVCRYLAFDVDSRDREKARELAQRLACLLEDIPHSVEFSGNKGYHIHVFFSEPYPAAEVRRVGEALRDLVHPARSGDPHIEVFPKQDRLTESSPLGNLLRLPLGVHPGTHRDAGFVDVHNGWEEGTYLNPTVELEKRTTLGALQGLLEETDPQLQLVNLLLPYWTPGQRHNMALYTAGFLASLGWTEEAALDLVRALHEEDGGEGDLQNQTEAVTDTFQRFYAGERVSGFQGLSEILPNQALRLLAEIAGQASSSPLLQVIDRIRLDKGVIFLKVRTAARTILGYLHENGRLVQDRSSQVFWLDYESRELVSMENQPWIRLLHRRFGLNQHDSFGKQVTESVRLYSHEEASVVDVYRRSFWDGEKLMLNLGGSEVYTLTGEAGERSISLNGENGVMFQNGEDRMRLPNLFQMDIQPLSPWKFLVDDISFSNGGSAGASPTQQAQLLKAWITGIFFAQTMPTRPILTLLANSGAGKTTTARRILRLLEGPEEDVLGLVMDKPDSLRSSLNAHKVLVLDNLERAKTNWLTDMLNRVSTGSHIEIRKLYKTNEVMKIIPDCFVIITATDMPFSEETVFTRMLPMELAPLLRPRPEYQMQMQLIENFQPLWMGIIGDLEKVILELRSNTSIVAPTESRLADFTVFCNRIKGCDFLVGEQLMEGLGSLVSHQRQVLQESSPFIQALEMWVRQRGEDAGRWNSAVELNSALQRIASSNRIEWRWNSPQGLSRHIGMLEQQLVRYFGMSVRTSEEDHREIVQYRFERNLLQM